MAIEISFVQVVDGGNLRPIPRLESMTSTSYHRNNVLFTNINVCHIDISVLVRRKEKYVRITALCRVRKAGAPASQAAVHEPGDAGRRNRPVARVDREHRDRSAAHPAASPLQAGAGAQGRPSCPATDAPRRQYGEGRSRD